MTRSLARPQVEPGFLMIETINIRNFRCFEHLTIDAVKRFNIIVGDSGTGKTALLEALFLALAGNVEVSVRLKAQRGFDTAFSGPPQRIEESIWRDYFYDLDWQRVVTVELKGTGDSARTMVISRGAADVLLPFGTGEQFQIAGGALAPLQFLWRDAAGVFHSSVPRLTQAGLQMASSDETLPDFFYIPAGAPIAASENAQRLSDLSQENRSAEFIKMFTNEYRWISNLSIEVTGGLPAVYAELVGEKKKIPIAAVSGGLNRTLGIMLALASRHRSVVLVDEIEHGIYYRHKIPIWRMLLGIGRKNESQMFLTTHDEEWLEALVEAAGDGVEDIALWRLERDAKGNRHLKQFSGASFKDGMEIGGELR